MPVCAFDVFWDITIKLLLECLRCSGPVFLQAYKVYGGNQD